MRCGASPLIFSGSLGIKGKLEAMTHSIKSMRSFLIGSLHDFARKSNLGELVTTDNLTSLVVSIANYQEEGAKLIPEVYLCAEIDKILRLVPSSQIVRLGENSDAAVSISLALKKGAPLAIDGWCIFVDFYNQKFRFGIFRGPINPLALNIEKSVLNEPIADCPVVRITQVAPGCIEVRSAAGLAHTIILSDRLDDDVKPNAHFEELVNAICEDVPENIKNPLRSYFGNVIGRGLQESHGAIIVVSAKEKIPNFLRDGIILDPPISFSNLVQAERGTSAAFDSEQELIANAALIKGMIRSDGITVFSSGGSLLGYNCFIKSSQSAKGVSGGARSRAYATLFAKIGKGLDAVYSRSQDGLTKFAKRQK